MSVEVFPPTQGPGELRPGVLKLHTWMVSDHLCRSAAPPSAWSVVSALYMYCLY